MIHHDFIHRMTGMSTLWFFEHGKVGVDVFFAISGILICSRLLDEEQRFGSISLLQFYIRRAFRIIPPAILYLLVIALLSALAIIPRVGMDWFGALFFFRNYTRLLGHHVVDGSWFTGHFWSLSVEEHFYLLLPAILVLTHRKHRIKVLSALILLVAGNLVFQLNHRPWDQILYHTDTRLDSLFIPALMAILIRRDPLRVNFARSQHLWPLMIAVLFAFVTWMPRNFCYALTMAVLVPVLVLSTVINSQSILGRFLELPPLRYIGRISYSLYLWQQLFLVGHLVVYFQASDITLGPLQHAPLNYIATFVCAVASYYLLEKPAMRFGHQLATRIQRPALTQ